MTPCIHTSVDASLKNRWTIKSKNIVHSMRKFHEVTPARPVSKDLLQNAARFESAKCPER